MKYRKENKNLKRKYHSGLWLIAKNPKNSENHYVQNLEQTLSLILNSELVFYTNSDKFAFFVK